MTSGTPILRGVAIAEHPRLDALTALLASAQELVRTLGAEPAVRRAFDALAQLQPDDRITLATAIERAVKWRRVNESVSEANGVRLVANPNPRLFVRVVDKAPPPQVSPEPDDVLVGIARLLHRAPVLACDAARAVWEPA